jgi:hypothetical protein
MIRKRLTASDTAAASFAASLEEKGLDGLDLMSAGEEKTVISDMRHGAMSRHLCSICNAAADQPSQLDRDEAGQVRA